MQVVTTAAVGQLAGSFRLSFSHHNQVARTTDIAWNAVGAIRDEDPASSAAGVGAGESVQAKLQALENIGQVKVTRGSASSIGAYSWTVVFLSEPGTQGVCCMRRMCCVACVGLTQLVASVQATWIK